MFHNLWFLRCILLVFCIYFVNAQLWDDKNKYKGYTCPSSVNDIWNKTTTTAFQMNANFCHQTCPFSDTFIHSYSYGCFDACCFPCDCERPRCEIYGICCPDALSDQEEQTALKFHAKRKRLTCTSRVKEHYLVIRSCHSNYRNDIVRNLCEKENVDPSKIVEVNTRVSDIKTGVAYFNVYCALCNNIFEFQTWNISIACSTYLNVYKATTELEFFKLSLQEDSECYLKDVPVISQYLPCKPRFHDYDTPPIDVCNKTGKWQHYDLDIAYNCLSSSYNFHRLIEINGYVFKNIFCAICNFDHPPQVGCLPEEITFVPFTDLLNFRSIIPFNRDLEIPFLDCINDKSSQLECPTIQCSDGKIYFKNECVTPLSRISGLGYKLQLGYEYHTLKLINEDFLQNGSMSQILSSLVFWLSNNLGDWAEETVMEISIRRAKPYQKIIDCCLINISGEYKMKPNKNFLTLFREFLTFSLFYFNVHFIADTSRGRDEIENYFAQLLSQEEIKINLGGIALRLKYVLGDVTDISNDTSDCVNPKDCLTTGEVFMPMSQRYLSSWRLRDTFQIMTPILTCAHVSYKQSDFKVEIIDPERPWRKQIALSLGETNIQFNKHKEFSKLVIDKKNNTLKICVDLLHRKIAQLLNAKLKGSILLYQYILTMFCLSISIACLSITLLVNLNFSILRNISGLHNICLTGSLLLSQVLLLASSHVSGPSAFCTGLGILTHFVWLNTFCWSFFCCFHMYSVFKAKNRTKLSHDDKKKYSFKRVILAVLASATGVSCVIVYDFLSSDGQRMGYGQTSCYLNSANLIIYSMGIPIACVLACNMYFFLSSVYKIYKIKQLQSNVSFRMEEIKQMCVYIKLSTMTGVFWFVAILSEALDSDPLRFLAIILNGLQGLFIFVSYICNKRILTLCLQWFYQFKPQKDDTTTEQGNTNVNKY